MKRRLEPLIREALAEEAAVVLVGPRQVGKTTLAQAIGSRQNAAYFDLEDPEERARLREPRAALDRLEHRLVILDEIHRAPELLHTLRGVIDRGRLSGKGTSRFLVLGSASLDILRTTGETLAGRVAYFDLFPFDVSEVPPDSDLLATLFQRGGYPRAFLAASDRQSFRRRRDLVKTYLQREVAWLSPRLPAETLGRLWTMLAHSQGAVLNASRLAGSLGVSANTVARYLDTLTDLLLIRRLPPLAANIGKRLVKSPKIYLRDSGLVHALLDLPSLDAVAGHPVVGASFEGFAIENLMAAAPDLTHASFFRTAGGAEMDLVLDLPGGARWAVEIKWASSPSPTRGFHFARETLQPDRCFLLGTGNTRYPIGDDVEVIGLRELVSELAAAGA